MAWFAHCYAAEPRGVLDSGQNLTGWGTVVEMLSRISEPVLLGLAALLKLNW